MPAAGLEDLGRGTALFRRSAFEPRQAAVGIYFANALDGGCGSYSAANDQARVVRQGPFLLVKWLSCQTNSRKLPAGGGGEKVAIRWANMAGGRGA
jgi:hypothetical protein